MPKLKKSLAPTATTSANVGYEAQLWQMADALRGSMATAEYKHVCLGLMFLKYRGRVYDPWLAGPSGMLAQSVEFRAFANGSGSLAHSQSTACRGAGSSDFRGTRGLGIV